MVDYFEVILAAAAVLSAIIAALARHDTNRQAELQKQEVDLHKKEWGVTIRGIFDERVRPYHQKLRELVWVKWIQCTGRNPSGGERNAALNVVPCFEALPNPYYTYYAHALQHLDAYDLTKERDLLMKRIEVHNLQVKDYNEASPSFPGEAVQGAQGARAEEGDRLRSMQSELWKQVQEFGLELQEVVNNLEDGQLKGECDFERNLKQELGL